MLKEIVKSKSLSWNKNNVSEDNFSFSLSKSILSEIGNNRQELKKWDIGFEEPPEIQSLRLVSSDIKDSYLTSGLGFVLIKGLDEFSDEIIRKTFCLLNFYLGKPLKQNIDGDVFVEVKNRGKSMKTGGRYHQTSEGGSLHTDSPQWENAPDLIGLLCLKEAKKGGESILLSAYNIHNEYLTKNSSLLPILYENFHFDKRGEYEEGESPTTVKPIFSYVDGELRFRYLRDYIDGADVEDNLKLKKERVKALDLLDEILENKENSLRFFIKNSEILLFNNHRIIHGRTSFVDFEDELLRRLMVRSWISTN